MEQVTALNSITYSNGAIECQMQRIFEHPNFSDCGILKKFLSFVVQETLSGNADCLKEYTIAVKVLSKPVNFNPQHNCIVRIHAGRLRRALHQYYEESGSDDQIVISIPKGKYVPQFNEFLVKNVGSVGIGDANALSNKAGSAATVIAVLPFICAATDDQQFAFADNICLQISDALMKVGDFSVIAYPAIKSLAMKFPDYKELGASIGFNYIITGGIQFSKEKTRVTMQLVSCYNYQQVWSETHECNLDRSRAFEIQDEITACAINRVKAFARERFISLQ